MTSDMKGNSQETALLFLHAQTALHPGSGTALGVVDLPIQRERHTRWPLIPGSSLKGVLRDTCRRASGNNEQLWAAFGPESGDADKYAGAISVTDARILAFPVRSLRGVFAWVTCASVLERFQRDRRLAGSTGTCQIAPPGKEETQTVEGSPLLIDGDKLVLEEFEFRRVGDAQDVARFLSAQVFSANDAMTPQSFEKRLAVLHDDDFNHFVQHATEVVARIGLNPETKVVKDKALFYQEFLPTESLFYAVVFANSSRNDRNCDANSIMSYLRKWLPPVLQIGGDETTGKGLCAVRLATAGKDENHDDQ